MSGHETTESRRDPLVDGGSGSNLAVCIDTLIERQMGIVRYFSLADLEAVQTELVRRGFTHEERFNKSNVSTGKRPTEGELHRHGIGQLIVHRTIEGSGTASFYWPEEDVWDFPYDEDLSGRAVAVHLKAGDIVIFPSQSWHQFGTDAHQNRSAEWRHYSPPVE